MIWIAGPTPKLNPHFHTAYDVDDPAHVTASMKFAFRCACDVDGVWKLEGGVFDGNKLKGVPAPEHETLDAAKAEAGRCARTIRP